MRHFVKSNLGWLAPLAFLALPDCALTHATTARPFNPGDMPRSSVIFCDIENKDHPRVCASPDDIGTGVRLAEAAIALTTRHSNVVGLDYSPAAATALSCASGTPVRVTFRNAFPEGTATCLNCGGVIGPVYADVAAACVAVCKELNGGSTATAFCDDRTHAHPSTNAPGCFDGACTEAGALRPEFSDPRRQTEPVVWTSLVNAAPEGPDNNTLRRPASTPAGLDAGAASVPMQSIRGGDGYVEFTITELGTIRALGLSTGTDDTDSSINGIDFAVRLSASNALVILERGARVPNPLSATSEWGSFHAGDRIRIKVRDRFDGTADITYSILPTGCTGPSCSVMPFGPSTPQTGSYPFRVDAFLRDPDATLTDVRLVRIQ